MDDALLEDAALELDDEDLELARGGAFNRWNQVAVNRFPGVLTNPAASYISVSGVVSSDAVFDRAVLSRANTLLR